MEILLFIVGLGGLCLLALRFGYDSRETFFPASSEEIFAGFGYEWQGKPVDGPRPAPVRRPAHALRHRVAVGLNLLADWLYPVATDRSALNGQVRLNTNMR